jgi:GT2 family glycosyltransferase
MNLGLRHAAGKYVLFTEDDIVAESNAVELLVGHMESNPDTGLAGGIMFNRSARTVRCAGGEVRLGQRFDFRVIQEIEDPRNGGLGAYPVTYLPGAFLLARRELLEKIGGFWDELFMYSEDVELCVRATSAGARIVVVPTARVWHLEPPLAVEQAWLTDVKVRNHLWVYVRHAPLEALVPFLVRFCVSGLTQGVRRSPRHTLAVARAVVSTVIRLPTLLRLRWAPVKTTARV